MEPQEEVITLEPRERRCPKCGGDLHPCNVEAFAAVDDPLDHGLLDLRVMFICSVCEELVHEDIQ